MSGLSDRVTPLPQNMYEATYGSSLVSCQILLVLYGIASLQCYIYYLNYPTDSTRMKVFVAWIWLLATLHATFIAHTVWHYSVESYTNPKSLLDGEWSVYTGTTIGIVACFTIQVFFTRIIFLMTQGTWRLVLSTTLGVFLLGQMAFGTYFAYSLFHLWELLKLHEAVYTAMVPLFVIRVVSDTIVSAALCVILYDSRAFSKSMKLVNTLIVYSINRFILTTFVVVVQTIILIKKPDTIWAMVIEFVSAQLYVNSFMAMLNSRNRLRKIGTTQSVCVNSHTRPSVSAVSAAQFRRQSYSETDAHTHNVCLKDLNYEAGDVGVIQVSTEAAALSNSLLDRKNGEIQV